MTAMIAPRSRAAVWLLVCAIPAAAQLSQNMQDWMRRINSRSSAAAAEEGGRGGGRGGAAGADDGSMAAKPM